MTTTTANPYTRTEPPRRWERAAISDNARVVLERRYLRKDEEGNLLETAEEMFRRVARNLAQAEAFWGNGVLRQAQDERIGAEALRSFDSAQDRQAQDERASQAQG